MSDNGVDHTALLGLANQACQKAAGYEEKYQRGSETCRCIRSEYADVTHYIAI